MKSAPVTSEQGELDYTHFYTNLVTKKLDRVLYSDIN